MFQCLGLGTVETGGCGEDWWHPECLIGLPRGWRKAAKSDAAKHEGENGTAEEDDGEEDDEESLPPGFPEEDDFETFICYKCLDSNPWLKRYANTPGFLPPVHKDGGLRGPKGAAEEKQEQSTGSRKRKADEAEDERDSKRAKGDETNENENGNENGQVKKKEEPADSTPPKPKPKHESLPRDAPTGTFSLFVKEDFRERLCHCPECFPNLIPHPQLREEEETYEPPLSEDGDAANGSQGTGSLLERGEAALSNMDRVKAIEGVMVYNHLRDKVKEFLKPFAESGKPVSAEDIKAYFEKLRGDDLAIKEAGGLASAFGGGRSDDNGGGGEGDNRREQSGK